MSTSAFADSQHPITWPAGFTAAASFTFDVDAESCVIAHDPTSTRRMSLMSHQSYGPKVAVPRLLQILARQEVRGTFFIPGFTAESYPDVVRQIVDGGHEVAHHGYLHEPMQGIDAATEAGYMDRGLEALEKVAGIRPVGYRAPWWELNWHSPALLADRGFLYDSSLLDGDAPYRDVCLLGLSFRCRRHPRHRGDPRGLDAGRLGAVRVLSRRDRQRRDRKPGEGAGDVDARGAGTPLAGKLLRAHQPTRSSRAGRPRRWPWSS
jgi:peptidoglycan/xylan/chitin deacetylase (PgdA/CDA1 family)